MLIVPAAGEFARGHTLISEVKLLLRYLKYRRYPIIPRCGIDLIALIN